MVVPWSLVLTAAAGIVLGVWWAGRRGRARGVEDHIPGDVGMVLAIAGVVAGRLVVLASDIAVVGLRALDPRAALTLGAGVSTSGALLGVLAAGVWLQRRGRVPEGAWRAAVPPVALGLAVWSALSLLRGAASGIAAPFPFGLPLGGPDTRVPVGLLEAVAFGAFAWAVWRAERRGAATALARMPGSRLAALLLAVAASVHLVGGLLRAPVATVDGDLDVLLGVLALGLALVVVFDVPQRTVRRVGGAATAVGALGMVAVLAAAPATPGGLDAHRMGAASRSTAPSAVGTDMPRWAEADLAAFVRSQDRPVVVNVWASWCPPCRAEAPVLRRAAQAYGDRVVFLGVNVDGDPADARAFEDRYGLPFPSVTEDGLRPALGVAGLPTTVVVRPDGTIAARIVGGVDARSLAAAIDRAR